MAFKSTRKSRRHRTPRPENQDAQPFFQPKLTVGTPGDKFEREADAVADKVVGGDSAPAIQAMPDSRMEKDRAVQEQHDDSARPQVQRMVGSPEEEPLQRQPDHEDEDEPLQMMEEDEALQAKSDATPQAPANLGGRLRQRAGKGKPLAGPVKAQMETGFGRDFSGVSLHTDAVADDMNRQLGARAFARGQDVYFRSGAYQPDSAAGQRLLAHELTHTVQQNGGGIPAIQKQDPATPTPKAPATPTITDYAAVRSRADKLFASVEDEGLPRYTSALYALDVGQVALTASALEQLIVATANVRLLVSKQAVGTERDELLKHLDERKAIMAKKVFLHVNLVWYQGKKVGLKVPMATPELPTMHLRRETIRLLPVLQQSKELLELLRKKEATSDEITRAVKLFGKGENRPVNIYFKKLVLEHHGLYADFVDRLGVMSFFVTGKVDSARKSAARFGALIDAGGFSMDSAEDALSYGGFDWAVTDEEAEGVFKRIAQAEPAGRAQIIKLLHRKGFLGRLFDNLPWRHARALHDSIADARARELLRPYFVGKGGGQSMQKIYESGIMSQINRGNYGRAYGLTFLSTAHNALTLGFMSTYSEAYDLREQGYISDDALLATGLKAAGRSAAILGASIVTGGAAAGLAEGTALGLGVSKAGAVIIGGTVGGVTTGVTGKLTEDLFNVAAFGQDGLSSAEDYLLAAGIGGAAGLVASAASTAAARYSPASAQNMNQIYAAKHPRLAKLYGGSQAAGQRIGQGIKGKLPGGVPARPELAPSGGTLVNKSTPERYFVQDSADNFLHAEGSVNDIRRELTISLRAVSKDGQVRSSVISGKEQYQKILQHFEGQFDHIKGNWQYGTNLGKVNQLTAEGMPLETAVTKTWSAAQAAEAGFTKVTVRFNEGTPGNYSHVEVRYSRP